jgi:hypothetical protein
MWKQKIKIPTIPALLALAFIASFIVYSSNGITFRLGGKAQNTQFNPKQVTVSNITDTGFTVSWITDKKTTGFVTYQNLDKRTVIAYDTRDSDSVPKTYYTHYVPISLQAQNADVLYSIVSGTETYPQRSVSLKKALTSIPSVLPVYGTLQASDEVASEGIIVLGKIENSTYISQFVVNSQNWLLTIAKSRTSDYTDYFCNSIPCTNTTGLQIEIKTKDSIVKTTTDLQTARPYENPIVLTETTSVITPENTQIPITLTGKPIVTNSPTTVKSKPTLTPMIVKQPVKGVSIVSRDYPLEILSPKNNSSLTFPKPLIRGLGVREEKIAISLKGEIIQIGETTVDQNGIWMWTPIYSLSPGTYTLIVKSTEKNGMLNSKTAQFTILPNGLQVLSASTPSATLIPTITSIISPTNPVVYQSPTPTIPVGGSFTPTVFYTAAGLILIGTAVALTLL